MPQIDPQFALLLAQQSHDAVYTSPRMKGDGPALTVKAISRPGEAEKDWYYYAERVGKDSVAFLLYDTERDQYQCLSQLHGPLNRYVSGAFTGSFDKQGLSPTQILIEEIAEEAGYAVTNDAARILALGVVPVSSQTNEEVHLFLVDITGLPQNLREPENVFEKNVFRFWLDADQVLATCEWKAQSVVLRHTRLMRAQPLPDDVEDAEPTTVAMLG